MTISNIHLPSKWSLNTVTNGVKDGAHAVGQVVGRSMQWLQARQPTESPKKILGSINTLATEGLERAASQGIRPGPEVDDLKRKLGQAGSPEEITAVQGKDYWQGQIKLNQEVLVQKVTVFIALLQMRDKCASGKQDKDNLGLIKLVMRATEGPSPESVWKIFTETYAPTWTEKVKLACFYLSFYKTCLIANTVRAYLGTFIRNIQGDLMSDNSAARNLVFRKVLENVKAALIADNKAKENFANRVDHRTLEAWQNHFIEEVYKCSLQELCKRFSEKRVSQYSPTVCIFGELQKIAVIGWIFKKFESLVNRWIIQDNMKSILPDALKETVTNGLKATQPHHLPFALGITHFLTSQLSALKTELDMELKGKTAPPTTRIFAPGELSPVVKELIRALDLETNEKGHTPTASDLKYQIAEIDKREMDRKSWHLGKKIDQMVEESIEEGIENGGNLLLNYLDEITQSGKLFAQLLELAAAPFSSDFKDAKTLEEEYTREQIKFEELGEEIVAKIVSKSIDKTVKGDDPEETRKISQDAYREGQTVSMITMDKLSEICARMTTPGQEDNLQTDIASILKILQIFTDREEILKEIENLEATDQNAIWRVVTPLYEKATKIAEQAERLTDPSIADKAKRVKALSDEVNLLRQEIKDAQANIYPPLPPLWAKKWGFAAIGGAVGAALPLLGGAAGSLLGPAGTAVGTALGVAASASIYPAVHYLSGLRNGSPDAVFRTGVTTAPLIAAPYLLGAPLAAVSGAAAGYTYDTAMRSYGRDTVRPRVDRIRKNAYIFLKSPRVWKALATRTLHELS